MMDEENIKKLINELEGPKLDHKSKDYISSNQKDIAKDISAFMNAEGGCILIGVKDNKADGLVFTQKDEERITSICRDRLVPPQPISIECCMMKNETIVIIKITSSRGPVRANDKYYIRFGSTNRLMTHDEIRRKFAEEGKIYKIIDEKDAYEIINQIQISRDIILHGNKTKMRYLTFDSDSGPRIGSDLIVFGNLYESFNEKSKLIFSTLHKVTMEELVKILAQYYRIFGNFSYGKSAFSIGQSGFNWVGFGPSDFIETLQDQKERYKSIHRKYGEDIHIHHRESAFFIDEIRDGFFFVSCEPNYSKYLDNITIDYFDVGFVFKEQPFSRLFNDFFRLISIEPFTLLSNDKPYIITKHIKIKEEIPFKPNGLIQSIQQIDGDNHVWVSGAYGKIPQRLSKLPFNYDIMVNIRHHHWIEDEVKYHVDRIKYAKIDLGCFSSIIFSIDVNW